MKSFDTARSVALQCSTVARAAHGQGSSLRRTLLLTVALACLDIAGQAPAANQQQERMKACNAQAQSQTLSGAERKDFMKRCLGGQDEASVQGLNSQQRKMKTCSAEAKSKELKGSDRKQFMSSCLKSSS